MEQQRWVTEGAFLFALPVGATTSAFVYQWGYGQYFGIPANLISLSWTSVALALLALTAIFQLFLSAGYVLAHWMAKWTPWITTKTALSMSAFVAMDLILLIQHGSAGVAFRIGVALTAGVFVVDIVFRLTESRPGKDFWVRFREVSETGENAEPLRSAFNRFLLTSMWVLISMAVAWSTGYTEARDQKTFLVTSDPLERVVLRKYGDVLVLAEINRAARTVGREFSFESLGADPTRVFVSTDVGPLVSKKEE